MAAYDWSAEAREYAAYLRRCREQGEQPVDPDVFHAHYEQPDEEQSSNPFVRSFVDWDALFNAEHPLENWLLEPFIARGAAHAVYAGAKAGKTFVVLAGCAALAAGRQFLSQPAGPAVHVLYCDYENSPGEILDRVQGFGYTPAELVSLHYALLPSAPPLDTKEGAWAVVEAAEDVGAELVVIDTMSRATKGPENDSDTIRDFYRCTGLALKTRGIAWMRLDHSGYDASHQRGTSGKNDDVDVVWRFTRGDAGRSTLEATHRRMAWVPERITLQIGEDDDGLWTIVSPELDEPTWPDGTGGCVKELERLGVPVDVTCRKARDVLKQAGVPMRYALIVAAVKARKWTHNRPGTTFDWVPGNRDPESPTANPQNTGGNAPGTMGTTRPGSWEPPGGYVVPPGSQPQNDPDGPTPEKEPE